MLKLLSQLKKLFYIPTGLESYIASKNPSTPAEVDYWVRQYDQQQRYRSFI
jgi:hypothetical protein